MNNEKTSDIDRIAELCADCGNCLHYCPVYNAELEEPNSPRGKVNLIKALHNGTLKPTKDLELFTDQCLLCGSCQYICTKGVDFTSMMTSFRNERSRGNRIGLLKKTILTIYSYPFLKSFTGTLRLIPSVLRKRFNFLPIYRKSRSYTSKDRLTGNKVDILLFPGCMINLFYPEIKNRIINFLELHGYSVTIPKGLRCCGSPYKTQGWNKKFLKLKKKNEKIFKKYSYKYLIVPCGTGTKTFLNDYELNKEKTFELTQFIYKFIKDAEVELPVQGKDSKITYHDPCHNRKLLGIKDEPRHFMKKFGNKFVDDDSEFCCGFGGLFSLNFSSTSKKILNRRVEKIEENGAGTVVTSCPGCYYQLQKKKGANVKFFIDIFK